MACRVVICKTGWCVALSPAAMGTLYWWNVFMRRSLYPKIRRFIKIPKYEKQVLLTSCEK